MKTAITITIVAGLMFFVMSLVNCRASLYRFYDEFPEQANVEHLRSRIPQVVQDIDAAIANTESALSLASALEKIIYPEEILLVAMHNENYEGRYDKKRLDIVNQLPDKTTDGANSKLGVVVNGGGYGNTNGQHYWILQQPLKKYNYEYIEIYIKRKPPEQPGEK